MEEAESTVALPAAWYPDPDDTNRLRWWDGAAWTDHVQQLPPPPDAPEVKGVAEAFIIKKEVPEAGTWYAETGNRYVPRSSDHSVPAALRDAEGDSEKDDDIGSGWTVESFVLALLPIVLFGLQYFVWTLGDTRGAIFVHSPFVFWIFPAVLVIASPILSTMDGSALNARNFTTAPNGLIGILPPIYLILRLISVGASSILPLVIWIASVAALVGPGRLLFEAFTNALAASTGAQ